ncbi:epididymal-specific lipocalin-9 isoform X2 [Eubalaena glacialis]|uniref:epididymal-specific lipocalin-9 isoform X2 n=1 Tax=Eubalaena glacialis TaxID=27606 RepID=UPI002A5B0377|nr:epididymal-specific lipocalin-9 isoform X2 [Eubalaena glacialis]
MALLLLSLELSLVSAQDFNLQRIVRRNHDISKVLGTWYSISMAADDMRRIEEDGDLRVFIQSIESLENGGLKFSFHFMLHTECVDVAMVCDKTDKNGEYTITYLGENRLQVLEADYLRYVTFHLRNFRNGTETQVLALYGRFPELKPSFLYRFEKICKSHGLGPENIVNLSNNDPCRKHRR